jgi:hypothetical protein
MNFFKSIPSSKETNEEELLVISYPFGSSEYIKVVRFVPG